MSQTVINRTSINRTSIIKLWWRSALLGALVSGSFGCATSSLFMPYPGQMTARLEALDRGETVKEVKTGGKWNPDRLLHYLERGRLAQISQQDLASLEAYRSAINLFNEEDLDAVVELSEIGDKGASLIVNDNAIAYKGEIFERGFVHIYQAMNYLMTGDLEGAGVEIRRLNRVQKNALRKNEKALVKQQEKAEKKLAEMPVDVGSNQEAFDQRFASMDVEAAKLKYSFQNGFGFYVSGLVYECRGELNDAYIDYKKALELNAGNEFVQQDVIRLAKKLGFTTDYQELNKSITLTNLKKDNGEIIVLYERGFVPQKREVSFSIPDRSGTFISISFPVYNQFLDERVPLTVRVNQDQFYKTQLLAETSPMVAKALKDKRPGMMARQIARGFTKAELHHQSEKKGGVIGSFMANIYSIITERADLRSWLSLPNNAQLGRYQVKAGQYPLMMRDRKTGAQREIAITVEASRKTIVYVVNTGRKLWVRSVVI